MTSIKPDKKQPYKERYIAESLRSLDAMKDFELKQDIIYNIFLGLGDPSIYKLEERTYTKDAKAKLAEAASKTNDNHKSFIDSYRVEFVKRLLDAGIIIKLNSNDNEISNDNLLTVKNKEMVIAVDEDGNPNGSEERIVKTQYAYNETLPGVNIIKTILSSRFDELFLMYDGKESEGFDLTQFFGLKDEFIPVANKIAEIANRAEATAYENFYEGLDKSVQSVIKRTVIDLRNKQNKKVHDEVLSYLSANIEIDSEEDYRQLYAIKTSILSAISHNSKDVKNYDYLQFSLDQNTSYLYSEINDVYKIENMEIYISNRDGSSNENKVDGFDLQMKADGSDIVADMYKEMEILSFNTLEIRKISAKDESERTEEEQYKLKALQLVNKYIVRNISAVEQEGKDKLVYINERDAKLAEVYNDITGGDEDYQLSENELTELRRRNEEIYYSYYAMEVESKESIEKFLTANSKAISNECSKLYEEIVEKLGQEAADRILPLKRFRESEKEYIDLPNIPGYVSKIESQAAENEEKLYDIDKLTDFDKFRMNLGRDVNSYSAIFTFNYGLKNLISKYDDPEIDKSTLKSDIEAIMQNPNVKDYMEVFAQNSDSTLGDDFKSQLNYLNEVSEFAGKYMASIERRQCEELAGFEELRKAENSPAGGYAKREQARAFFKFVIEDLEVKKASAIQAARQQAFEEGSDPKDAENVGKVYDKQIAIVKERADEVIKQFYSEYDIDYSGGIERIFDKKFSTINGTRINGLAKYSQKVLDQYLEIAYRSLPPVASVYNPDFTYDKHLERPVEEKPISENILETTDNEIDPEKLKLIKRFEDVYGRALNRLSSGDINFNVNDSNSYLDFDEEKERGKGGVLQELRGILKQMRDSGLFTEEELTEREKDIDDMIEAYRKDALENIPGLTSKLREAIKTGKVEEIQKAGLDLLKLSTTIKVDKNNNNRKEYNSIIRQIREITGSDKLEYSTDNNGIPSIIELEEIPITYVKIEQVPLINPDMIIPEETVISVDPNSEYKKLIVNQNRFILKLNAKIAAFDKNPSKETKKGIYDLFETMDDYEFDNEQRDFIIDVLDKVEPYFYQSQYEIALENLRKASSDDGATLEQVKKAEIEYGIAFDNLAYYDEDYDVIDYDLDSEVRKNAEVKEKEIQAKQDEIDNAEELENKREEHAKKVESLAAEFKEKVVQMNEALSKYRDTSSLTLEEKKKVKEDLERIKGSVDSVYREYKETLLDDNYTNEEFEKQFEEANSKVVSIENDYKFVYEKTSKAINEVENSKENVKVSSAKDEYAESRASLEALLNSDSASIHELQEAQSKFKAAKEEYYVLLEPEARKEIAESDEAMHDEYNKKVADLQSKIKAAKDEKTPDKEALEEEYKKAKEAVLAHIELVGRPGAQTTKKNEGNSARNYQTIFKKYVESLTPEEKEKFLAEENEFLGKAHKAYKYTSNYLPKYKEEPEKKVENADVADSEDIEEIKEESLDENAKEESEISLYDNIINSINEIRRAIDRYNENPSDEIKDQISNLIEEYNSKIVEYKKDCEARYGEMTDEEKAKNQDLMVELKDFGSVVKAYKEGPEKEMQQNTM